MHPPSGTTFFNNGKQKGHLQTEMAFAFILMMLNLSERNPINSLNLLLVEADILQRL